MDLNEGNFHGHGLIKVPENGGAAGKVKTGRAGKESSYRKVAKFLILIGADEAAKVLAKLSQDQVERIVLEISSIKSVDPDEAEAIFSEFQDLAKRTFGQEGGINTARTILENAFGSDKAREMIEKSVPLSVEKPFAFLEAVSPEKLYRLVSDESPSVRAATLSQCPSKLAADTIALMPDEMKKETVLNLAKLKELNPDALRRLAASMEEKLRTLAVSSAMSVDGHSVLADILRKMDGRAEEGILASLAESDPELVQDISRRLFTLDDVILADDRFLQDELRKMKDHDIAALLYGKKEDFRNKILKNISKLRGASILEEEQACSPFSKRETDQATASFFLTVRKGWEDGKFSINGSYDDEWVE